VDAIVEAWADTNLDTNRERIARRLATSGALVSGRLELAIEAGGRLIGDIQARAPENAFPPDVYEIGITIHHRADRGRGYGTEAIGLLTDHLFDALGAERVQAGTALWNEPSRRAFTRLGFREEGVMRAFMPSGESRDDYVLLALTRADRTSDPQE